MMKNNIKIVRNELNPNIPNPPDFNMLAQNAGALKLKLIFQKALMFTGSAIAASVVVYFAVISPKKQKMLVKNEIASNIETKVIPPSKELEIKYDTLKVDVRNGDTLIYNGLTQIIVPPNSIVDAQGNPVESTKILFREFQNQTDIMMSGIPMTYDSAGAEFLFESGGMFEIKTINKEERIHAEKSIEVNLATSHKIDGFNAYQLDEKTGKWKFLNPIKAEPLKQETPETEEFIKNSESYKIVSNTTQKSTISVITLETQLRQAFFDKKPPVLASEDEFTFTVDPSQIEDLKLYENISFKPIAEDVSKVKDIPEELDYLTVEKTKEEGVYLLNFMYDKKTTKVKCTPVFKNSKDYKKALAEFQQEEKLFKDEQVKKQKEIERQMAENKKKEDEINKLIKKSNINSKRPVQPISKEIVKVAFNVMSFGILNIDRPMRIDEGFLDIEYTVDGGNEKTTQVFQYYTRRNAVNTHKSYENKIQIRFTSLDECMLVTILNDGKSIAILNKDKYQEQIVNKKKKKIVLEKIDKKFNSVNEINEFLSKFRFY